MLVLCALLLIVLDTQGQLDGMKGRAQSLLQPVAQSMTQARLDMGATFGSLTGRGALQQQIEQLERDKSALQQQVIQLQTQVDKIPMLEQELQIRTTYEWQTTSATVVQGSTDSGRRIIRIDRGSVDAVAVGMAVVAKECGSPAALIGVVDKVYAQTADVLLITDYGSTISARTAGTETPTEGLIAGRLL